MREIKTASNEIKRDIQNSALEMRKDLNMENPLKEIEKSTKFDSIKIPDLGLDLEKEITKQKKEQAAIGKMSASLEKQLNKLKDSGVGTILKELNLNALDLIKIDTEGSEYDILYSLQSEILCDTSWITGELHGNQDFELLSYLNSLGFSISLNKEIDNRMCIFHAGKPEIISQLSRKEIKIL